MGGGSQISNWQARPVMQTDDRCGQHRPAFQLTLTGHDPPGPGVDL
jgi:hypothetical protein